MSVRRRYERQALDRSYSPSLSRTIAIAYLARSCSCVRCRRERAAGAANRKRLSYAPVLVPVPRWQDFGLVSVIPPGVMDALICATVNVMNR